ncbi:MAG: alcohol dehydrogenase catalytic domain-containing protein [Phaeospirillum sp.]|nr:alcohol dehydrogenase catalytic domain-containing protein [Phaeospirillum sp.]
MQESSVETSVIIRCFNEQKHLPALFDALDRQTYRDFEVIVIDSGSYDRSRDIARDRADRLIQIAKQDFTFGYSLNTGIRAGRGRFMAIASAHTIPVDPHWLGALVEPLRDDAVAMTYGRQIGAASSKFAEAEDFERIFGPAPRREDPAHWRVNNANSAIRKDLWEQHPFDEELPGLEDIEWARHWMEHGHAVLYEPKAMLVHIHEETWPQIRRRYYREAVAWRHMNIKGPRSVPAELARELAHMAVDLGRAIRPTHSPVARRLGLGQRLREILYYRFHRNVGAVRGLLETHAMETRAERQHAYFDRPTQAVVIHGPGKAALEAIDLPEVKPGDVLIRVAHVAVCATDLEILNGTLGYFHNGLGSYPIVPGHEFSGEIVAIGQNVTTVAEGDPVVVECIQGCGLCKECLADNAIGCAERTELGVLRRNGAYAEFMVAPARFVHAIPKDVALRRAVLAEPLAVVLKGLRRLAPVMRANGRTDQRCLVIGAGPIGHMVAKVLAHQGHTVTVFDRNSKRRVLFDGTAITATDDLSAALAEHNVVVEATGDPEVLDRALHGSPANAALLLLGLPYGQRAFSFEAVAAYDKFIIGSVGSTKDDFEAALKLMGNLDLTPYFQCAMPLAQFRQAWDTAKSGTVLKVVLDVEAS